MQRMAHIYEHAYFGDRIVPMEKAQLSIASSAVLYGLSVYTVFPVCGTESRLMAFRLKDHFQRLIQSARIIGIDTFEHAWNYERFEQAVRQLVSNNSIAEDAFVRATVHVSELVAGTRSRGLKTDVSMFAYDAMPIIPQNGARLKSSVWRRIPDYAIPSRAKVNGAYVNSVLAKQDAIDSGYDDCVFLDNAGHVCEMSAANIFLVRDGVLVTPDLSNDLLEGINRRALLEIARDMGIPTVERTVDLTELYIADEVFACGTSAFLGFVKEIDARMIGTGSVGPVTARLQDAHRAAAHGEHPRYKTWTTRL
jgi:branched-chain amino acid aminotransferase